MSDHGVIIYKEAEGPFKCIYVKTPDEFGILSHINNRRFQYLYNQTENNVGSW